MRALGFRPQVVVDGGANRGQFFELARPVFTEAAFHLVEPQPACTEALEALLAADGGEVFVHTKAITEPGIRRVRMVGAGENGGATGSWVAKPTDHAPGEFYVDATTLDSLLDEHIALEHRALLKLDLESHELPALKGATRLLRKVEAILTEVSFFHADDSEAPVFLDVASFLRERGFHLYDFASLSGRTRDGRLRMGDAVFVREDSELRRDTSWE